MRIRSAIWVAAYLRRCQVEGAPAVLRRRGAEEAGAIFIKNGRLRRETLVVRGEIEDAVHGFADRGIEKQQNAQQNLGRDAERLCRDQQRFTRSVLNDDMRMIGGDVERTLEERCELRRIACE